MKSKRYFAALLAVCLSLTLLLPAWAAGNTVSLEDASQAVSALGILPGAENLSGTVTRAEFIAMAIRATPGGDGVGQAATGAGHRLQ